VIPPDSVLSAALILAAFRSPVIWAATAVALAVLGFGIWYGMGGQELAARMSPKGRHHAAFRRR
jgi:hypothetical protein